MIVWLGRVFYCKPAAQIMQAATPKCWDWAELDRSEERVAGVGPEGDRTARGGRGGGCLQRQGSDERSPEEALPGAVLESRC